MRNALSLERSLGTNYWSPIRELRREVDRLFRDFQSPGDFGLSRESEDLWDPACDMNETDNAFVVKLDVPGVKLEDLNLEVEGDRLFVSGERCKETEEEKKGSFYSERSYGEFCRMFTLPEGADTENVEAEYQDGILKIQIPKIEAAKGRQIPIKSLGGPQPTAKLNVGQKSPAAKPAASH